MTGNDCNGEKKQGSGIIRIKDTVPGSEVKGCLAVRQVYVRQNRNKPTEYLDLKLHDGEGEVAAKRWDHAGEAPNIGEVLYIEAKVETYQGARQLNITNWVKAKKGDYPQGYFLPKCPEDPAELWKKVCRRLQEIGNPSLQALVEQILTDQELVAQVKEAPASMGHHHATLSGLLQHIWHTMQKADGLAAGDFGVPVDRDLLAVGCFLHDIGKVREYTWEGEAIGRSDPGMLLGHIVMGLIIVNQVIDRVSGFPEVLRWKLLHMVASHHGTLEFGSPVVPLFLEAEILARADDADAQLFKFAQAFAETSKGDRWSPYIRTLGRQVWVSEE
ncbi:MAG: 3'-5' exoribonuclease YhaM family protein [Bacillota bacterium]